MKRRGWPETANTWEPIENLHSIADVIDSFEGRLVNLNVSTSCGTFPLLIMYGICFSCIKV